MAPPEQSFTAGRTVAIVVSGIAGMVFLLGLIVARGSDEDNDPHGYVIIFGTLLCIVTGLVLLMSVPAALAGRAQRIASATSSAVAILLLGLLLVLWLPPR